MEKIQENGPLAEKKEKKERKSKRTRQKKERGDEKERDGKEVMEKRRWKSGDGKVEKR